MNSNDLQRRLAITVKVFGGLRESFRGGSHVYHLSPEKNRLNELLAALKEEFPDLVTQLISGIDAGYLNVLVNGRNVQFLQGMDTPLQDGDTAAFLPPVGGG